MDYEIPQETIYAIRRNIIPWLSSNSYTVEAYELGAILDIAAKRPLTKPEYKRFLDLQNYTSKKANKSMLVSFVLILSGLGYLVYRSTKKSRK